MSGYVTDEGSLPIAPNVVGLEPYPSRVAAFMPIVRGTCPACGIKSLFLASGGYVTCANLGCPNPGAASDLLEPTEEEQG